MRRATAGNCFNLFVIVFQEFWGYSAYSKYKFEFTHFQGFLKFIADPLALKTGGPITGG
jgi:hypothetical protein